MPPVTKPGNPSARSAQVTPNGNGAGDTEGAGSGESSAGEITVSDRWWVRQTIRLDWMLYCAAR